MNNRLSGISDPNVLIGDGQQRDGRRVLYIEDNQSNLTLVEWILERDAGIALIAAMGGRRGIELAHEHQPDLIVLDLHLPDMPGETGSLALNVGEVRGVVAA